AREGAGAHGPAALEVGGDLLGGAVLEEASEEEVAGLEELEVLLVLDVAPRQEPGGLEVEEGRGDDEELARLADVPLGLAGEVGDELVGDPRQRDLGDVELVPGREGPGEAEGS